MAECLTDAALADFNTLLGPEHVIADFTGLERYRDQHGPYFQREGEVVPACAVQPSTVDELRGVLRIANEHRVPLWVISRGRNFGYGGPSAVVPGSVIVDLIRMNRILEINEKHAYAVVEPGVSQEDLWAEIQRRGLDLWQDGPSSPWGSIVGATSERGIGYGLLGDRMSSFCGMEVVLPDGDVVRTGMGAMSSAQTWQQYRWGLGPWVDGLFTQSNYGIITKLGIWLSRRPPCYRSAEVYVAHYRDVAVLLNTLRELRLGHVVENSVSGGPNYGGHVEGGIGPGGGRGIVPGVPPGWRAAWVYTDTNGSSTRNGNRRGTLSRRSPASAFTSRSSTLPTSIRNGRRRQNWRRGSFRRTSSRGGTIT